MSYYRPRRFKRRWIPLKGRRGRRYRYRKRPVVRYVGSIRKPEMKVYESGFVDGALTISFATSYDYGIATGIARGPDHNERVGDKIYPRRLKIKGFVECKDANSANVEQRFRIVIVRWKSLHKSEPDIDDIISGTLYENQIRHCHPGVYVMADKKYRILGNGANGVINQGQKTYFGFNFKLKGKLEYEDTTEISGIHVFTVMDNDVTSESFKMTMKTQLYYTDQ